MKQGYSTDIKQMKDIGNNKKIKFWWKKLRYRKKKIVQLENENRKNNVVIFGIEETEETVFCV